MGKRILFSILFSVLLMSFVSAQDIAGHWTGIVMDQYKVAYDFKTSGDTLTGTDTHYDGTVSDISNGRIMADSISFDVPIEGELTHVTGKLKDAVLTLSFNVQGYDLTADLKKNNPD